MRISETVHAENRYTVDSPFYRVNFWEQASPPRGWMLDAYILSEVDDLREVYQWIEEHARGRLFELFVEIQEEPQGPFTSPRKSDLIRLCLEGIPTLENLSIATFIPI